MSRPLGNMDTLVGGSSLLLLYLFVCGLPSAAVLDLVVSWCWWAFVDRLEGVPIDLVLGVFCPLEAVFVIFVYFCYGFLVPKECELV